ncbi:MAG: serine hydrolase [Isosphaeraceae bacterium]
MARSVSAFLAVLWLAAPVVAQGQDVAPATRFAPAAARLETLIERLRTEQGLPAVSIAVVDGDDVVWARGFGMARPAAKVAASADTIYRVGSVSKLFTDLALMQLVEAGKVDLDAPIERYLPDFRPRNTTGKTITLRQLMAHRSGLTRESPVGNYFDDTHPDLNATVASLNTTTLIFDPGAKTKYSNAGIAVVGQVVEKLRGEAFATTVTRTVLAPLGMTSSTFQPDASLKPRLADGLMWTYDGRTFLAPTFPLGTAPAGNLYASVNDLARFLIFLFGGQPQSNVVKPETLARMFEPAFPDQGPRSFGIGFSLSTFDGHKRVGHGGAVYGFATEVAALPNENLGVAVVINKDCANTTARRIADAALRDLLALRAGKPLPEIPGTEPTDPALAWKLAGRYGQGDDALILDAAAGRIYLTPARGGFHLLLRKQGDALVSDDPLGSGLKLTVTPDQKALVVEGKTLERQPDHKPEPAPERWRGLIGEYGWDHNTLYIHERDGKLHALIEWFFLDRLEEVDENTFKFPATGLYIGETLHFERDASGRATSVVAGNVRFARRTLDGETGVSQVKIQPVRPVAELRQKALTASPPEEGPKRAFHLVELASLDATIQLDIRYATANNFLGTPVYEEARAFLQRPAAESLLKAHKALKADGYGLLIHDAYRPWYVTKLFWDATPETSHAFVADPSKGSKHNRGCAVDLSLYDLATGKPVPMVGTYDEFSNRSSPDYPGGTSLERWHRDRLRRSMEAEGFQVNEVEWWHFDHHDWPEYPLGNRPFDQIARPRG